MNEAEVRPNPAKAVSAMYQSMYDNWPVASYTNKIQSEHLDIFLNQTANILAENKLHLSRRSFTNPNPEVLLDQAQTAQAEALFRAGASLLYQNRGIEVTQEHLDQVMQFIHAIHNSSVSQAGYEYKQLGKAPDLRDLYQTWIPVNDRNYIGIEWDEGLGIHLKYKTLDGSALYPEEKTQGVWQELFLDNVNATNGTTITFASLVSRPQPTQ